jgi:hypothetical protein
LPVIAAAEWPAGLRPHRLLGPHLPTRLGPRPQGPAAAITAANSSSVGCGHHHPLHRCPPGVLVLLRVLSKALTAAPQQQQAAKPAEGPLPHRHCPHLVSTASKPHPDPKPRPEAAAAAAA